MRTPARRAQLAVLLAVALLLTSFSGAFAQSAADTNFTTSVTYGNASDSEAAQILFSFYSEGQGSPAATENVTLNPNAISALYLGNVTSLTGAFQGSGTISANVPVVAVLVQLPQNNPLVLNRPLSNGFRTGGSQSTIATVLKDVFGATTSFSCQNADAQAIDIKVDFIDQSANTVFSQTEEDVPVGAAKFFEVSSIGGVPNGFNGSARASGLVANTSDPANIVCSVSELGTSGGVSAYRAKAFEGVAEAGTNFNISSALCDVFGGQTTAYAVTNASTTTATDVTVTYQPGGATETKNIGPGAKASFVACDRVAAGFNGAATLSSTNAPVVAIAKKFKPSSIYETAFSGEADGADTLRMPYVRWAPDADFNNGTGQWQRAFIAIQNVGGSPVNNVAVEYYDLDGNLVGTHTIASIGVGEKGASNPSLMTLTGSLPQDAKNWFGNPIGNQASAGKSTWGGGAVVKGPAGSQLIGIASIASNPSSGAVQEDYNAQR